MGHAESLKAYLDVLDSHVGWENIIHCNQLLFIQEGKYDHYVPVQWKICF